MLTEQKLADISAIKNIGYLWISVNEHDAEQYESVMGLPWARTAQRLSMIHQAASEGSLPFRVVMSRVGDGTFEDTRYLQWVAKEYPHFQAFVFPRGGWLGRVNAGTLPDAPDIPCVRWFDISITATGVVAHCCMDGHADYPIGNVNDQSVLEIYNAPEYRALRETARSRRDHSPCDSCTFL